MAGYVIALMNQARAENAVHDERTAVERSRARTDARTRNDKLKAEE